MNTQPTNFFGRPQRPTWRLTVVGARDVTPRMREVSLVGDDLSAFSYRPGQDLVLNLPTGDGFARRHYTIRRSARSAPWRRSRKPRGARAFGRASALLSGEALMAGRLSEYAR